MARRILICDDDRSRDAGYVWICSGYLVENGRVLLVLHNGFGKWVPPGGHLEPGGTFAETVAREFAEETGIAVEVLSTQPVIHPPDTNSTPEPVPFYVDVEREGFRIPAIAQFYYVRRAPGRRLDVVPQLAEVSQAAWFSADQLPALPTFEQVRSLAAHALIHHPDAGVTSHAVGGSSSTSA
ncbi:NUDIX domain-containing protein [Actinomadura kijaniata]|uniref:NUDIX domain-containing protein n=1 Tax=Actinomadura kijaniata TaxID=46161 RepID=UPI003F199766